MPLWILLCKRTEETFENTQWSKVKQMHPMWLCILWGRQFGETFENTQWRKIKQMQPMRLCILWGRQFEETFENTQWRKIMILWVSSMNQQWTDHSSHLSEFLHIDETVPISVKNLKRLPGKKKTFYNFTTSCFALNLPLSLSLFCVKSATWDPPPGRPTRTSPSSARETRETQSCRSRPGRPQASGSTPGALNDKSRKDKRQKTKDNLILSRVLAHRPHHTK